jgi:hypothetical protein
MRDDFGNCTDCRQYVYLPRHNRLAKWLVRRDGPAYANDDWLIVCAETSTDAASKYVALVDAGDCEVAVDCLVVPVVVIPKTTTGVGEEIKFSVSGSLVPSYDADQIIQEVRS